ncbi:MAG: nucleotidyl transferase AbiEii/AbiGii toxin family protein [Candidatus Bipolaricaulota bacterium]
MKERALQLARQTPRRDRLNVLREYLQAHLLFSLQSARAFEQLAFVGGSALRFLHGLRRFSEDLDFSLEHPSQYDLHRLARRIERDLSMAGFDVGLHLRERTAVHTVSVRVGEILHEAELTSHKAQKLAIRLEVDTNPPAGASTETTLVNRHFLLALVHHDLSSLMAGKVHAVLSRPHIKGRDIYDLLWYLSRREPVRPNISLLRNALAQTGWTGDDVSEASWTQLVADRLRDANFRRISEDVAPLLESPEERAVLRREVVLTALSKAYDPEA